MNWGPIISNECHQRKKNGAADDFDEKRDTHIVGIEDIDDIDDDDDDAIDINVPPSNKTPSA